MAEGRSNVFPAYLRAEYQPGTAFADLNYRSTNQQSERGRNSIRHFRPLISR